MLVEIQEMRGLPLTHQGFEKFCRVSLHGHTQSTPHPQNEHGNYDHDEKGHIIHKYDFASILNFHFEVEQRSYDKLEVGIEIVHKHRITGEKVEGIVKLPITNLKHGVYAGGWQDVYIPAKGSEKGKKVGEIHVRMLLHKEGLTKEQRRSTITQNMEELTSSSNSLSDSADSRSSGARRGSFTSGTTRKESGEISSIPSQSTIEAEARLTRLESELARAVQMMADVAEAVAKLSKS